MITVGDVVRLNAKHLPTVEAFVEGDARFTWREFNDEVNRLADSLQKRGVGPRDRVAVLARVSACYSALYFATAKIGAILVPLNFWHRPEEHQHVIEDSLPSFLLYESEFGPTLAQVSALAAVPQVVMPAPGEALSESWREFTKDASTNEPKTSVATSDPHMIMYTSGTTGKPKGATLTSERTVPGNLAMSLGLRLRSDDTFLNHFPAFHASCWDHMMTFMLVGARTVLQRQYEPGRVLELIQLERVTVLLGLPTMLKQLIEHPDASQADVSSIRLVYFGAYDPSGILDRVADFFGAREGRIEMAHTYGLTESAPFVTLCRAEDVFTHWGSIGRPLAGVEVELRDDDGRLVPYGAPGELFVKAVSMSGYWNNKAATDEAIQGDWMSTGDVGISDPDGYLRIVDRKKDVVRSGGHNIFSKQIEDCLAQHASVLEVAVIGIPDAEWEEAVCAVVVARPEALAESEDGAEALRVALKEHVKLKLAGYNVPRRVEFLEALPKNSVGKTQKGLLREQFGSVFSTPAGPV